MLRCSLGTTLTVLDPLAAIARALQDGIAELLVFTGMIERIGALGFWLNGTAVAFRNE